MGDPRLAVDGDPFTYYHSWYPDAADPTVSPAQPDFITVDMGQERTLSAVRFVPKLAAVFSAAQNPVVNMTGTPLRGVPEVSADGTWWAQVASVTWPRITGPNDVHLNGVKARYLRLRVDNGMGGAAAIAEITPYE
ncbi:discoidin domain-containing protein [Nonomuraea sp. AD125B]|uniref:discoidin domain-containing protein n=1 Tax=Nonomuraea sp. AD125B TaxID=3242897 RepID=UPI003528918A